MERFAVAFAAAIATYVISYLIYRKTSASFWGYSMVWFLEFPIFLLAITGVSNTYGFDIFTHTLGVPVLALMLVISDILLIELALVGFLKPVRSLLPKRLSTVIGIYGAIKSLQKYHAIPEPERVQTVFFVSLLGGAIKLLALMLAGAFA